MGSNCAPCHGTKYSSTTTTTQPTTTTTTTTKTTTTTVKPVTPPPAETCAKCHPTVVSIGGMKCETCHSNGAEHMKAPKTAKVKFTKAGAEACGTCHKAGK
jgi:hypothetical protein